LNAGILKKTEPRGGAAMEFGHRDTQIELEIGATRKATYGENRRVPSSAADKKDRVMNLEKENNSLKEKENLLN
jgi:hypothetical protein